MYIKGIEGTKLLCKNHEVLHPNWFHTTVHHPHAHWWCGWWKQGGCEARSHELYREDHRWSFGSQGESSTTRRPSLRMTPTPMTMEHLVRAAQQLLIKPRASAGDLDGDESLWRTIERGMRAGVIRLLSFEQPSHHLLWTEVGDLGSCLSRACAKSCMICHRQSSTTGNALLLLGRPQWTMCDSRQHGDPRVDHSNVSRVVQSF